MNACFIGMKLLSIFQKLRHTESIDSVPKAFTINFLYSRNFLFKTPLLIDVIIRGISEKPRYFGCKAYEEEKKHFFFLKMAEYCFQFLSEIPISQDYY